MPQISVIIPTYNRADLLHEAIESVLEQQSVALELIVVDDGSTDDTAAVVARCRSDGRVRYVQQPRQGRSRARNHGAGLAGSPYVAFLDSDDRFLPGALAAHLEALNGAGSPGVTIGATEIIDERGGRVGERRPWGRGELTLGAWLFTCFGVPSSTVFRRSWFERVGGFDPDCETAEDWDLFLRLACARCPMAWVAAEVCQYRRHPGNSTKNLDQHCHGSILALKKVFRSPDLPPELAPEESHALAWVHVGFAQRAFVASDVGRAHAHLRKAVDLHPPFAHHRKVELIEALLAVSVGMSAETESVRATIIDNLPIGLGVTPRLVRRARARLEMAHFFRLAASDTPRAAQPHLRAGLRLDARWLANRGVLAYLVRRRSQQ